MLGAAAAGTRTYDPDPCPGDDYVGHYGGVIRNNVIFVGSSEVGLDCGICMHSACGAKAVHNSVFSTMSPESSSIEWRWPGADVFVANNLVSHSIVDRGGAGVVESNIEDAPGNWLLDPTLPDPDLHLASGAGAIDAGAVLDAGLCDADMDGDPRDGSPDPGADEHTD